ncbi:ubiquitin carboxyl-terminal hydrolase (macronuclear) [Tetrahymena thermophila SB210]|uniref:ubiquitinyl hydrolase 1 n=1 Tax=Tetrahymena thermophila (strain SB210) TaxID=312017 RepID=Q23DC1_TETTS|nr:ubiquitin carboxyl-terminal hydrolase [Tetrahymena thermophila SB210]EAR94414.2 ubiquitin carboxyl-terminal hydrolase [Tetrahymena thermophila SB210]|eukprot:XP_001014765.2 ubiquitin carboxyl-terminal hydrolase [Tetrahymena thermophila SB210]
MSHQENFQGIEEGVSAAAPHQHQSSENSMEQEEHKDNIVLDQGAAAAGVIIEANNSGDMEEENHILEEGEQADTENQIINEELNLEEKTQEQEAVKEQLVNQALKFKELWEKFNQDFESSPSSTYFVLSSHWLRYWKKHVSYDRVIKGKEPIYEHFAKHGDKLENANKDLIQTTVDQSSDQYYEFSELNEDGSTIILKPQLQEIQDYAIVDKDIVNLLSENYLNFQVIPRRAFKRPDGKKGIEIYYRKVNLIILNHSLLKDIDGGRAKSFTCKQIQLFSKENQEELKHFLVPIIKRHQYNQAYGYQNQPQNINLQTIRLWKLKENDTIEKVFQQLFEATRRFTSFEYKLKSPIVFIERNNNNTVEELNIEEDSTIFVEVQRQNGWTLKLEGEPDEDQCEFCRNYKVLKFECKCQKVKYCSDSCKFKDQEYHARVCDKAGEDSEDEQEQPYKFENDSVRGLCGLQNLGNTCFMNSALQCMSNTIPLTIYFLKKIYLQEINEQNVLGTQGKLAKQYAKFIKNLWTGNQRTFSPIALKMAVARLQSMFSGYQQHDSQEFLSYILDGLHEDLNRVKVKKYTESIDSNGRPDQVVAKESWLNHLKRNQSIIVDLMQGQFKSKVTCPDCSKESITFDPFLTCSLPIPNKEIKVISMYLIFANNRKTAIEVKYTYEPDQSKQQTIKDLKEYIQKTYQTSSNLILYSLTFDRVKDQFDDETPLENVRKTFKEPQKNALMIEYDVDIHDENKMKVFFTFTRLKEEMYMARRLVKSNFTFIRPFIIEKKANKKDVHLALFEYLKPIFLRNSKPDSEFAIDAEKLKLDELYEKYILNVENPPYRLLVETDAQDYIERPCTWCNQQKCKNCPVQYNDDEDPMEDFSKRSKSHYHSFRFECFVDQTTDFGRMINSLHSLDHSSQNNDSNTSASHNLDAKTNIYDCLKLFEQPERLGEDNEWYCPECKKHQKAQKQIVIYRAPDILILHLKRFKGSSGLFKSKLTKVVDFPIQGLDMTDFVIEKETPQSYYEQDADYFKDIHINPQKVEQNHIDESFKQSQPTQDEIDQENNKNHETNHSPSNNEEINIEEEQKNNDSKMEQEGDNKNDKRLFYDLYAITNHYGSLGFGHYTAYAQNNNRWFCFDDSCVRDVTPDQLVSEASYILFYKRRK